MTRRSILPIRTTLAGAALTLVIVVAGVCPAAAGTLSPDFRFQTVAQGGDPRGVVADSEGNLYGQTSFGGSTGPSCGSFGCGVIYKVTPDQRYSTLATFTDAQGLALGSGPLALRGKHLYGATYEGAGDVYSIETNGSNLQVLHAFAGPDGYLPVGTLAVSKNGVIYGSTAYGGPGYASPRSFGYGVLYQVMTDGSYISLHNFTGGADGAGPNGVVYRTGHLFGAAGSVVYKFDLATSTFTTLYTFPGVSPFFGPTVAGIDSNGNIFGYTYGALTTNVPQSGTLFELAKQGKGYQYINLFTFDPTLEGAAPSGLTVLADDTLVGVTSVGPQNGKLAGYGILFSFANGVLTTLGDFDGTNAGRSPYFAPVVTASGEIFGTSKPRSQNCASACGVIFRYIP